MDSISTTYGDATRDETLQENILPEKENIRTSSVRDGSEHSVRVADTPVTWNGPDDPQNPHNWSVAYRLWVTVLCAIMTFNVTFASSAPSFATSIIASEFDVSEEVTALDTSLFLLGIAFGPVFWGPGSEVLGRRPMYLVSLSFYTILHLGQGLAQNIQTLLITRFLASFFGSAPLTLGGGLMADLWGPIGRGRASTIFIGTIFLGPSIGPLVSGFILDSGLGWRWVFWVMMMFAGAVTFLGSIFMPETYAPVLLLRKAKHLRKEDPSLHGAVFAELEVRDFTISQMVYKILYRPFEMLLKEPILVLITIYLSAVYGVLYSLFEAFPIIFMQHYSFTTSQTGLVFIGIAIGVLLAAGINLLLLRNYGKDIVRWEGNPPPELRLYSGMVAGPCLVVGSFFMGWTAQYSDSVPWWVPALSTPFIGAGVTLIFMSFLNYIVDTYMLYAASAFAANVIVRSLVAAAFPLFTNQMYHNLGLNWGSTLIGCISLVLAPMPFLFYKFGPAIRSRSKFSPSSSTNLIQDAQVAQKATAINDPSRDGHV